MRSTQTPEAQLPRPATFVGRDDELADLRARLRHALNGAGQLLLLSGGPGIGKTRLVEQLSAEAADEGALVLAGRCWEGDGVPAYWPWIQIIRVLARRHDAVNVLDDLGYAAAEITRLVPELSRDDSKAARPPTLPTTLEPEQVRFRLFDSITEFLVRVAAVTPLMLVLDDVHWADAPSVRLLEFLASQLPGSRVFVIAIYRDADVAPHAPLDHALGELTRTGEQLTLLGLGPVQVRALIEATAGEQVDPDLAAAVHKHTGGNPFFVREVIRLLAAQHRLSPAGAEGGLPIPASVRDVLARRLARLSQDCVATLGIASVLGVEFHVGPVAAAAAVDRARVLEQLDEAVAAGVVAEASGTPGVYAFVHALIRETVYEQLSASRRARIHASVGEALEAATNAGAETDIEQLAHHFFQAAALGSSDKAVHYCRLAAERASAALAYEDAAAHLERGLHVLELQDRGDDRRAQLLLALGEARWRAGETEAARDAFRRVAEIARAAGAPDVLARAALGYAGPSVQGFAVRTDEAIVELLGEALSRLGTRDHPLAVRLMARIANEHYWSADDRRFTLSAAALAMARRLGNSETLLVALYSRHWASLGPDTLEERLSGADEIVRIATNIGDREMLYLGHQLRVTTLMEGDDILVVDAEIAACDRLADELRMPLYRWQTRLLRALRALMSGRLADTERLMEEAVAAAQPSTSEVVGVSYGVQLFFVRWLQGRLDEIAPMWQAFAGEYPWIPSAGASLALTYTELGRQAEARSQFAHLSRNDFADLHRDASWLSAMWCLANTAVALRDTRRAALLYEQLEPYAERTVTAAYIVSLGSVSTVLGMLASVGRRWKESEAHFTHALDANTRMGNGPLVVLTLREHAASLLDRGERGDEARAADLLRRASEMAAQMGLAGLESRIGDLRQQLGSAAPAPVPDESSLGGNVFRRDGDYWTVAYAGTIVRLKDAKGLADIAALLGRPGKELHVADLMAASSGHTETGAPGRMSAGDAADAGLQVDSGADGAPLLDAHARQAYRARLDDLREEHDDAERMADTERAARARTEMDFLATELASAYGLGGRTRRASGTSERARKAVTWRMRQAVNRITTVHPELGRHLRDSLTTGTFCAYTPTRPTDWTL